MWCGEDISGSKQESVPEQGKEEVKYSKWHTARKQNGKIFHVEDSSVSQQPLSGSHLLLQSVFTPVDWMYASIRAHKIRRCRIWSCRGSWRVQRQISDENIPPLNYILPALFAPLLHVCTCMCTHNTSLIRPSEARGLVPCTGVHFLLPFVLHIWMQMSFTAGILALAVLLMRPL